MQRNLLRRIYIFATTAFFLIVGVLLLFTWPFVFNFILESNLVLRPGNRVFHVWKKNPFPLKLDFYLFNWTNPDDIYNSSVKPRFQEIGPYRVEETKEKVNMKWHNNDTVTFRLLRHWYFNKEESSGDLDDLFVTANPVLLTAAYQLRDRSYFMKFGFSVSSRQMVNALHSVKTVGQVLFQGYEDPLIDTGKYMPAFMGVNLPEFDKFGWFYTRNGSSSFDGVFNMATGGDNVMGTLMEWNYKNRTEYNAGSCGEVRGSAGELYGTKQTRTSIEFFSPDMCRYVPLDYTEDVMHSGINGYKYSAGKTFLDNGTEVPENACFCSGECVPSGALNISACRYGSPGFVSLPHFYGADPSYLEAVEGLAPEQEKHELSITLEPTTGIALDVAARLQLNLLLQPYEGMKMFEDVPKIFFPVLWFEQKAKIPDDMTGELKMVLCLPNIIVSIGYILITISLFTVILLLYGITKKKPIRPRYDCYISEKEQVPLQSSNQEKCSKVVNVYSPKYISTISK